MTIKKREPETAAVGETVYEITKVLSFRFLKQEIIDPETGDTVTASARVKLMQSKDFYYLIEIKDDIFYPDCKILVVDYWGYLFDQYAKAVQVLRRLGYDDLIYSEGLLAREIRALTNGRDKLVNEWLEKKRKR
jgi:hypothetical protein